MKEKSMFCFEQMSLHVFRVSVEERARFGLKKNRCRLRRCACYQSRSWDTSVKDIEHASHMWLSYLSFHFAECISSPLKDSRPSISGHAGLFKFPLALIRTSAVSCMTSPLFKFFTVTCHSAVESSHRHSVISCDSLINLSAEYFFATRSR